ncbi:MAG: hypothetical protein Q9220_006607 [cf. Caloplaca sp. 1 TL-2023]
MAPQSEIHHHRSTTKISHKPFKSRHATKGFIKELTKGKIDRQEKGSRKTPHQQVMSKLDRRNQAKQMRQIKHQQNVKSTSVFAGQNGAPRIVAVVPLCEDCDASAAITTLNRSVDINLDVSLIGPTSIRVERFGQNISYFPVEYNFIAAVNACRVADFVLFLLSSQREVHEDGEQLIRMIEGQGVSNVVTMVQHLDSIQPAKKQPQVVASLKSFITHFFPNQDKVHSLDSDRECVNVLRSLCTSTPKGVVWREDRSWMLVENVEWAETSDVPDENGKAVLTGVVRGKGMKADRLLQVGDWGHFQIEKIVDATIPNLKKRKFDEMIVETDGKDRKVLETPDQDQDDLDELAPYDETMENIDQATTSDAITESKGVLLDDHHYFSDEDQDVPPPPKRLPTGTSTYQSAWYLGDMSDSYSSDDDQDIEGDNPMPLSQDDEPVTHPLPPSPTEATPSEYPASEAFANPSPNDEANALAAYRSSRNINKDSAASSDFAFPDEIELHPNVLARDRLSRYRGLRSLKTSTWDTSYDKPHEPQDYDRLLPIPDPRAASKTSTRETLVGGVQPGTRVSIHLRNVPLSLRKKSQPSHRRHPLTAISLLRHEHKRSVIHTTISLPTSYSGPAIKSKQQLIIQIGFRRFLINPLFSEVGTTPNNVHKYLRFLHSGQTAVASFIAPVTWGSSVPTLFFLPSTTSSSPNGGSSSSITESSLSLLAQGTLLPPSPHRILTKRIILTGHPYKIHKKLVTVRYMFFNKEDVEWFKALRLWTKRGRQGFVRESLGTHGYFKAAFDGKIGPMDAVGVSLYKRVWPRGAVPWNPGLVGEGEGKVEEVEMGDVVV